MVSIIQSQPICGNLPLSGYLLETVQRIPRYKLLLQGQLVVLFILIKHLTTDYLKHLPEDSNDRQDSESTNCTIVCYIRI